MRSNFCFDFVILVADHDANVRKYRELLGIEPIELAPESLPSADTRCTVFPLWNEGDRGMVLSLVTPGDPDSAQGRQLARRGEGLALFGIDVDDVDALVAQGRRAGVEFASDEPLPYDYGRMVFARPATTNGIPFFFSTHREGWWRKTLDGGLG